MSSSTDAMTIPSAATAPASPTTGAGPVLRGSSADTAVAAVLGADLRGGTWTRAVDGTARGDAGVETALSGLADAARESARAAGYAAGWSEGRREAELEAAEHARRVEEQRAAERTADRARVDAALAALTTATARADEASASAVAAIHAQAVELAVALAEAVIGEVVADAPTAARAALSRALLLADADEQVTVRLNPADHATLTSLQVTRPGIVLVADPAVQPGDATAFTSTSVIDASAASAIARVREVLS